VVGASGISRGDDPERAATQREKLIDEGVAVTAGGRIRRDRTG
jgi:hypothetical protein